MDMPVFIPKQWKLSRSFIWVTALLIAVSGCGQPSDGTPSQAPQVPAITGISLSKANITINIGDTVTVAAIENYSDGSTLPITDYVSWNSDNRLFDLNPHDDGTIEIKALRRGTSSLVAQSGYFSTEATIKIMPTYLRTDIVPDPTLVLPGFTGELQAIERYNDGIDEDVSALATWSILDNTVGTVSGTVFESGRIGQTQVTAEYNSKTGTGTVEVVPVKLIGEEGLIFPPPNNLMHRPSPTIDGLNKVTAIYGYQGSGEIYSAEDDGSDQAVLTQINSSQSPSDFVFNEKIVSGNNGARLVIWEGNNGEYSAYAKPNEGFGDVKVFPTNLAPNMIWRILDMVITDDDEVIVLWVDYFKTMLSKFDPATDTWSQPLVLQPFVSRDARLNSSGDAILIGQFRDSTTYEYLYFANIYISSGPDAGLQTSQPIYISPDESISELDLAINDNRDAIAVWSMSSGLYQADDIVYAAQYSADGAWKPTTSLPMGDGDRSGQVRVAINNDGKIIVAWTDLSNHYIYANRYTEDDDWITAEPLKTNTGGGTTDIYNLSISSSGNAICIYDGGVSLYSPYSYRLYIDGVGWQPQIEMKHIGLAGEPDWPRVSYNDSGFGIIAWKEKSNFYLNDGSNFPVGFNFMELAPNLNL